MGSVLAAVVAAILGSVGCTEAELGCGRTFDCVVWTAGQRFRIIVGVCACSWYLPHYAGYFGQHFDGCHFGS